MRFSSNDPTPINDTPEDTDITDSFKYIQDINVSTPFPAMPYFCNKPNLKTAKALLRGYHIPFPLETLLKRKPLPHVPNKKEYTKQQEQEKEHTQKGSSPPPNNNVFYELLLLDTLHDLQNYADKKVVYNIFKREIGKTSIPITLKTAFLSNNKLFTKEAASYIQKIHPVSMISSTIDVKVNKQNDIVLQKRLDTIKELNFVLDNICAGVHVGNDMSDGTIGLLGCAFILVLLSNMKRLDMIHCKSNLPNKRDINLYDGLFLNMDGNYVKRFLILFCKTLKRLSGVNNVYLHLPPIIQHVSINHYVPKYFNTYFPNNSVIITKSKNMNQGIITIQNPNNTQNQYPIIPGNTITNNQILYPHDKIQFAEYVMANTTNQDLWYLNFLRDAFKADVAVEKDYIYMTHDRLAHLYYKLIGGNKGFLLAVDDDQDGRVVYSSTF